MTAPSTDFRAPSPGPELTCAKAKAAVAAIRPDIEANGPDALRALLRQTDALLGRMTHWSKCQRAARYRTLLAIYHASRDTAPRRREDHGEDWETVPAQRQKPPGPLPSVPSCLRGEYDLVVPLGTGSKHDNLELRHLLRSALLHLSPRRHEAHEEDPAQRRAAPGAARSSLDSRPFASIRGSHLRRIHIIGPRRPPWLADHPMIRWHQWRTIKPKNHDIIAKFLHAANHPDVAETFLGTCDDFLFLAPLLLSPRSHEEHEEEESAQRREFPGAARSSLVSPSWPSCLRGEPIPYGAVRHGAVLSTSTDKGYWKNAQAQTRKLLDAAGYPHLYYDYHVPTVMTKTGWRKVDAEIPWRSVSGHAVWSLYHNVAGIHGPPVSVKPLGYHAADGSRCPKSVEEIDRAADGQLFLCYNDGGLKNGILQTWLETRHPTPAPWEADFSPRRHEGHEEDPAQRREAPVAARTSLPFVPSCSAGVPSPSLPLLPSSPDRPANPQGRPAVAPGQPESPPNPSLSPSWPSCLRGESDPYPRDLDILVVLYGHSLPRAAAVAATFAKWHRHQQPMPRVLCAWCYRPGNEPGELANIPDYPWFHKIVLPQYDLDDGVFRKEGLLNLLLRDHSTAPYILTLDADVWPPRPGWFRSIRDKLAENPDHVLQPFRYFKDTKENVGAYSWSAQTLPDTKPSKCKHPGLGWAFTKKWGQKHGKTTVFNPWLVTGSGDCMFILEHFPDRRADRFRERHALYSYFQRACRPGLPVGTLACIDAKVWHQNHTNKEAVPEAFRKYKYSDRAYRWSRLALTYWGRLEQYVFLDPNGVPTLRDPDGPFAKHIRRKPEMQDKTSLSRIIAESLGIGSVDPPILPQGRRVNLSTWPGIGDHLMMLGVVNRLHRERPDTEILLHLTLPGLEPWFRAVCPSIQFAKTPGQKLVWRHGPIPPGKHAVSRYGADPKDIALPPPDLSIPSIQSTLSIPGPRIAFVTETGGPHLARKQWPHWQRLAELVRKRLGVEPFWIGTKTKADPIHILPALLATMDAVLTIEGMASHLCWAIRKPAVVLVTGALDPSALCYPGFHTILRGTCPYGKFCECYMRPDEEEPQCAVECMSSISPEGVFAGITDVFK